MRYNVKWRDNKAHPGEIVDIRSLKGQSAASSSSKKVAASSNPSDLEYYIHYPGFDRRLDEWVRLDRIAWKAGPIGKASSGSDSKGTASSINHRHAFGGITPRGGVDLKRKERALRTCLRTRNRSWWRRMRP